MNLTNNDGWTALHNAAHGGHLSVVSALVDKDPAGVNARNSNNSTALHVAAQNGHLSVVECLLGGGADVNLTNNDGWTALCIAAQNRNLQVIECLLGGGADVKLAANEDWTALRIAAKNGHLPVVQCLLKAGADVNLADNTGVTALHLAAELGHLSVVECLLVGGASVNLATNEGITALHLASGNGHLSVVKCLLVGGADINISLNDGTTTLAIAAGHPEISKILKAFVDLDNPAIDQEAKQQIIESIEDVSIFHMLIMRSSDFMREMNEKNIMLLQDKFMRAAAKLISTLFDVVASDEIREFISMIEGIQAQMSQAQEDTNINTALWTIIGPAMQACEYVFGSQKGARIPRLEFKTLVEINKHAHSEILKWDHQVARKLVYFRILKDLSNGNIIEAYDTLRNSGENEILVLPGAFIKDYQAIMHLACAHGDEKVAKLMIDQGVDVNSKGDEKVAQLMIHEGLDVEIYNENDTPLHLASSTGNIELVRLLLWYGADFTSSDAHNKTPLDLASEGGHEEIVTLLLSHRADANDAPHDQEVHQIYANDDNGIPHNQDVHHVGEVLLGGE